MKPQLKHTLTYLLIALAGGIIWAGCQCPNCPECPPKITLVTPSYEIIDGQRGEKLDTLKIKGDTTVKVRVMMAKMAPPQVCNFPCSVNVNVEGASFNNTYKTIDIHDITDINKPLLRYFNLPTNQGWIKVTKSSNYLIFTQEAPPSNAVIKEVIDAGSGDQNRAMDIVKNAFQYPNTTLPNPVYRIVGSDNGRNITSASGLKPGGDMAWATIDADPVYFRQPSATNKYEIAQAPRKGLDKQNHTATQADFQSYDINQLP